VGGDRGGKGGGGRKGERGKRGKENSTFRKKRSCPFAAASTETRRTGEKKKGKVAVARVFLSQLSLPENGKILTSIRPTQKKAQKEEKKRKKEGDHHDEIPPTSL